jgi:hypothetical protein
MKKNQPAAKQRDTLARNKGKIKAKNENIRRSS